MSSFQALAEHMGTILCSASAAQLEAKDIARIKKGRYKASDRVKSLRRRARAVRKGLQDKHSR